MDPPTIVPGGNPVTETPGLSATFPVTVVGPVLVTVELPRIVTLSAAPSGTTEAAADQEVASSPKIIKVAAHAAADQQACFFCAELFRMRQMQQRRCYTWARRVRVFAGENY